MSSSEGSAAAPKRIEETDALEAVHPLIDIPHHEPRFTRKPQVVAASQTVTQQFSGPMPPPEFLARYESIFPGSAERMLAMAEKEAEHRRTTETTIVQSQISHDNKQFAESRCGQLCALVITLAALAAGVYTAIQGYQAAGSIIGVGGIGGIVTTFIFGRKSGDTDAPKPNSEAKSKRKAKQKPQA